MECGVKTSLVFRRLRLWTSCGINLAVGSWPSYFSSLTLHPTSVRVWKKIVFLHQKCLSEVFMLPSSLRIRGFGGWGWWWYTVWSETAPAEKDPLALPLLPAMHCALATAAGSGGGQARSGSEIGNWKTLDPR